jgi:hypothetical protein
VSDTRRRPDPPCIYCGGDRPPLKVEHVMSRALGTYLNNWTLSCVCDDCNHYFSKFELALGRDSLEAIRRLDLGVKPPADAAKLLYRRVSSTVAGDGPNSGMHVDLVAGEGATRISPAAVAQVAFRLENESEWTLLRERDLTETNVTRFKDPTARVALRLIVQKGQPFESLLTRLRELGIAFVEEHRHLDRGLNEPGQALHVQYDVLIDDDIRRATSKIVFNYATFVFGADVMRRPEFDHARRFIRFGEEPEPIATAKDQRVLAGPESETTTVHACGVQWVESFGLVGLLTLFNHVSYWTRLAPKECTHLAGLQSAHVFDPIKREIRSQV